MRRRQLASSRGSDLRGFLLIGVLVLVGCSNASSPVPALCTAGASCIGTGSCAGTQVCGFDGTLSCACPGGGPSAATASSTGATGAASTGGAGTSGSGTSAGSTTDSATTGAGSTTSST